jgi:heme/copper-type cytochrome/quinol oxidase subunit 2
VNRRSLSAALVATVSVILTTESLHACPVCFRLEDSSTISGVYAAVTVLLGVTTVVLSTFGVFVVRFVKRARLAEQTEAGRHS